MNAFECLIYDHSDAIRRFWWHMLFPLFAVSVCALSILFYHGMSTVLQPCFRKRVRKRRLVQQFLPQWHTINLTVKRLEVLKPAYFGGNYVSMDFKFGTDATETDVRTKTNHDSLVWERTYRYWIAQCMFDMISTDWVHNSYLPRVPIRMGHTFGWGWGRGWLSVTQ